MVTSIIGLGVLAIGVGLLIYDLNRTYEEMEEEYEKENKGEDK